MPTPEPLPSPVVTLLTRGACFAASRNSEPICDFVDARPDTEHGHQVCANRHEAESLAETRRRLQLNRGEAIAALSRS